MGRTVMGCANPEPPSPWHPPPPPPASTGTEGRHSVQEPGNRIILSHLSAYEEWTHNRFRTQWDEAFCKPIQKQSATGKARVRWEGVPGNVTRPRNHSQ